MIQLTKINNRPVVLNPNRIESVTEWRPDKAEPRGARVLMTSGDTHYVKEMLSEVHELAGFPTI